MVHAVLFRNAFNLQEVMESAVKLAAVSRCSSTTDSPFTVTVQFSDSSTFCSPQVKNFGRSGRTKYTHLVDQDTTSFDSAWAQESAQNSKFFKQKAAGVRDVFDRPTVKKRKT